MILKQALIKSKKNGTVNDYEILVNNLDSIKIKYDHDNKKKSIFAIMDYL